MHRIETVTIRRAHDADAGAMLRLAALDSARPPEGEVLVAEVAGEPWAAIAIATGDVIADPFHPTAGLAELLRLRAAALAGEAPRRARRARLLPRAA